MSHLPFAIAAYFLNSVSVLVDKVIISKQKTNPLTYVFFVSALSLIALIAVPFTPLPTLPALLLASLSTLLWTYGAYYLFSSLQTGQASRVVPIIGTLTPIFLLIHGSFTKALTINQTWAAGLLITGLIILIAPTLKGKINHKEFVFEVLSALLFALSYILLRDAFLLSNFLTVFSWSKLILIPIGLLLLCLPAARKIIFAKQEGSTMKFLSKRGVLFIFGQACGGSSQMLLNFSISLATPALVNSLQGIQYLFIFIFSVLLSLKYKQFFKENLSPFIIVSKVFGLILVGLGLYILAFAQPYTGEKQVVGVTFSPRYARELGLNPVTTFHDMVTELGVRHVRLPVYWDEVEKKPNEYNFADVDFYLDEAQKNNVEVILTLGYKQPRWPECFAPKWFENLSIEDKEARILTLIAAEVNHFKKYPNIKAWQVENEPVFPFGLCSLEVDQRSQLLPEEIQLVKQIDPTRPIILTDSGELSTWQIPVGLSDWFGTTLYRVVGNPYLGLNDYPLPPFFYQLKDQTTRFITGSKGQKTIVSELQAEPWPHNKVHLTQWSPHDQFKTFSPQDLNGNITFAKETGFAEIYLWGVEWWYFMRTQGYPEYLEVAKNNLD